MTTFKDYWKSLSAIEKKALTQDSGKSYSYLCQLANGQKKAGMYVIQALTAIRPEITPTMLRPDVFSLRPIK